MTTEQLVEILTVTLPILIGGIIAWYNRAKLAATFLGRAWKLISSFAIGPKKIMERLDRFEKRFDKIEYEMSPNGGGSIKDKINVIYELSVLADARVKHMISMTDQPMYECRVSDGFTINVNEALCNLFGMTEPHMLGNGWLEAIVQEERAMVWTEYQRAIKEHTPYSWTYTVENQKTGKRIRVKTKLTVLRNSKGAPVLYTGMSEPVE